MDTLSYGLGLGNGCDTTGTPHIQPHAETQLRPAPAGEWDTDQIPEPLARPQQHPDDKEPTD